MATTVRATCPDCGDVRLDASQVVIRSRTGQAWGQYRFICPQCGKIVLKDASEQIMDLLRTSYVREEFWELPLEILERPADEAVLSEDDLIDLGLAFDDGSAFDRITRRNYEEG